MPAAEVHIQTMRLVDFMAQHADAMPRLLALCPTPEMRLLYGYTTRISNDLYLALSNDTDPSNENDYNSWIGVVYEGVAIVGCGLAYDNTCSLFIEPSRRRRGYGSRLVNALRACAGDVLVGSTAAGYALQQRLDSKRSLLLRIAFWIWRRRPRINTWWNWSSWFVGVSFSACRLDFYFLPLHLMMWFPGRQPPLRRDCCDHGVSLIEACTKCVEGTT
jgi:GNAT superfamily N-acetyltransferase